MKHALSYKGREGFDPRSALESPRSRYTHPGSYTGVWIVMRGPSLTTLIRNSSWSEKSRGLSHHNLNIQGQCRLEVLRYFCWQRAMSSLCRHTLQQAPRYDRHAYKRGMQDSSIRYSRCICRARVTQSVCGVNCDFEASAVSVRAAHAKAQRTQNHYTDTIVSLLLQHYAIRYIYKFFISLSSNYAL